MKSYNLFLLLILSAILTGCEKVMHPEEESIATIDTYDELVTATNGVYGLFQECISTRELNRANVKGDDINLGNSIYETNYNTGRCWNTAFIDRSGYNWVDWNGNSSGVWYYLYLIIASANNILYQYDISSLTDKDTREILGEIYLIRAYCYFRLVRTYGEIPVIDNININYSVKKSSFTEIYQFIETDLKKSMILLPFSYIDARKPNISPHRGSAKAILAEVYLSWAGYPIKDDSKYTLAAQTAKEVIDSASFFGFGLLDDYGYVWDQAHLYNTESVYSIFYTDPLNYAGSVSLPYESINREKLPYSGTAAIAYNYSSGIQIAPGISISIYSNPAEIKFYHDFPTGYRKEITFFTNYWEVNRKWDDSTGELLSVDSVHYRFDSTNTCGRVAYRKFYNDPYIFDYYINYPYNGEDYLETNTCFIGIPRVYLYRYSHTLLTYAEAAARSGQLNTQAFEYVNQIRRRARHMNIYTSSSYDLQTGISPEVFADSVVWERAWEHAAETEGRWFDLVRLEKVEDLPKYRNPYEYGPPGFPLTKGVYFFPIPATDKILNPYLDE